MGATLSYERTVEYLYERLPVFSRIGKDAIRHDLTNIRKLCAALDSPHQKFKSVHIAGTNGKGSTSHALSATLQHAGYKTGLYTSPHLIDFRERIRIDGKPISKEWVVDFVEKNNALIEEVQPSFFEITVAMAFVAFAEEKVDIAVIETGLGGRLDSTNIITPLLSIITNISYDHKDILGDTLQLIAAEKAGIIKPGVPVLVGEQSDETERVFFEHAFHNHTTIYYADALWDMVRVRQDAKYQYFKAVNKAKREIYDIRTDLLGNYQQHNIKTVLTAIELLSSQGFPISLPYTLPVLSRVKQLTGLQGRWEILQEQPVIICDVAHNPAGLKEVMQQWQYVPATTKHIITGFVKDKDVVEALSYFPKDAVYYFCQANMPRALPSNELKAIAEKQGLTGNVYASVTDALTDAKAKMQDDDALLITGSFFIAAEAMELLQVAV